MKPYSVQLYLTTSLFITGVTGKLVLRAVPAHHKVAIQLGSFPTGIYFLRFFTGTKWDW